jgi:hypothetical protein
MIMWTKETRCVIHNGLVPLIQYQQLILYDKLFVAKGKRKNKSISL